MRQLCKGNVAVVKGAILSGCRSFYGYPITPASEIAEYAALLIPQVGGTFLQAESEVSAINMGGGHGCYRNIVLAPASVQEMCDLTIRAFELADKYRNPAVILTDGFVGQMMEPLDLEYREIIAPLKPWA